MPVFHTKTIESILEPVANQVKQEARSKRRHFSRIDCKSRSSSQKLSRFSVPKITFWKNDSYSFKEKRRSRRRRVGCRVAMREDFFLSFDIFLWEQHEFTWTWNHQRTNTFAAPVIIRNKKSWKSNEKFPIARGRNMKTLSVSNDNRSVNKDTLCFALCEFQRRR